MAHFFVTAKTRFWGGAEKPDFMGSHRGGFSQDERGAPAASRWCARARCFGNMASKRQLFVYPAGRDRSPNLAVREGNWKLIVRRRERAGFTILAADRAESADVLTTAPGRLPPHFAAARSLQVLP